MNKPLSVRGRDERRRQIKEEGRQPGSDIGKSGELLIAAGCYSMAAIEMENRASLTVLQDFPPDGWPWSEKYWKPTRDPARMREKAYGLLLAAQEALEKEDSSGHDKSALEAAQKSASDAGWQVEYTRMMNPEQGRDGYL